MYWTEIMLMFLNYIFAFQMNNPLAFHIHIRQITFTSLIKDLGKVAVTGIKLLIRHNKDKGRRKVAIHTYTVKLPSVVDFLRQKL